MNVTNDTPSSIRYSNGKLYVGPTEMHKLSNFKGLCLANDYVINRDIPISPVINSLANLESLSASDIALIEPKALIESLTDFEFIYRKNRVIRSKIISNIIDLRELFVSEFDLFKYYNYSYPNKDTIQSPSYWIESNGNLGLLIFTEVDGTPTYAYNEDILNYFEFLISFEEYSRLGDLIGKSNTGWVSSLKLNLNELYGKDTIYRITSVMMRSLSYYELTFYSGNELTSENLLSGNGASDIIFDANA